MTAPQRPSRAVAAALLAALALPLAAPPMALAAPGVTLSTPVGPPTSKVTVTGSGFGANAAVDVFFDTADLCLALASAAGDVSCKIAVPATAQPGAHFVSVVGRSSGTGAQLPFTVRTDVPQFHGRAATHTGKNPYENTINTSNVADLEPLWTASIGAGTLGAAVVSGGIAYVSVDPSKLYAFNASTGTPIAGFPVSVDVGAFFSPAVGGGRVFVLGGVKLSAFNATTGAPVGPPFPITVGGAVASTPTLALGNVYVGADDGKLYAFSATTGAAVSGFPVTTRAGLVVATPTVVGGNVYVGLHGAFTGTSFFAFDALTGAVAAGFPKTIGFIESTAAASNGAVFVGTFDSNLEAFEVASGAAIAGFPAATVGDIASSPAIAGSRVFVGSADGKIQAFGVTGGAAIWSTALDADVLGSPVVANGVLYVNTKRRLYALSKVSGSILWTAHVGSGSFSGPSAPVIANGILYLGSRDGNLYAFSVNGDLPSASSIAGSGHALGTAPRLSSLRPDLTLVPRRAPAR